MRLDPDGPGAKQDRFDARGRSLAVSIIVSHHCLLSDIDRIHFRDEVERLAKECKMRLYRTSVKEDLNVSGVFQHLAENYVNKVKSYADPVDVNGKPLFQIGASSSRTYSTSKYVSMTTSSSKGPLYITKPAALGPPQHSVRNGPSNGYIPSMFSNTPHPRQQQQPRRYYQPTTTNYVSSFSPQDYLNNPMFDSLNHHRRYWPHDKTITLRPLATKAKNSGLHRKMTARNACKVLS